MLEGRSGKTENGWALVEMMDYEEEWQSMKGDDLASAEMSARALASWKCSYSFAALIMQRDKEKSRWQLQNLCDGKCMVIC